MIRVVHRLELDGIAPDAFARAWREALSAIRQHASGCHGGLLLRSHDDPSRFTIVTRWESIEAWREFWGKGPPEPQGDPERNEVFLEIDEVGAIGGGSAGSHDPEPEHP
jgi:heme-degrading monooxygenase HmoA